MTAHVLTKAVLAPEAHNLGVLLRENAATDGGHRLLWTLFARDSTAAASTRLFLYRRVDDRTYMIVSEAPPHDAHKLWQLGPKPYDPRPVMGERYRFILRANPAMAISQDNRKSLRVDAVMHAKRQAKASGKDWQREDEAAAALAWLHKREDAIGVRFAREACHVRDYVQGRVPRKDAAPARFSTVDFEGAFEVVDSAKLVTALFSGIGKARAFGCGLMLIRRLPSCTLEDDD
jgi:CRISPR system Cascade subunit CasE